MRLDQSFIDNGEYCWWSVRIKKKSSNL